MFGGVGFHVRFRMSGIDLKTYMARVRELLPRPKRPAARPANLRKASRSSIKRFSRHNRHG